MMPPLPTLTLHEPWATLIAWGPKRIENRTWKRDGLRGRYIGVHASKRPMGPGDLALLQEETDRLMPAYGQLVGFCRVDGFITCSSDYWFDGPIGWLLSDVQVFESPIVVIGAQGVWDLGKRFSGDEVEHWEERHGIRSECMPEEHARWFAAHDVLRARAV